MPSPVSPSPGIHSAGLSALSLSCLTSLLKVCRSTTPPHLHSPASRCDPCALHASMLLFTPRPHSPALDSPHLPSRSLSTHQRASLCLRGWGSHLENKMEKKRARVFFQKQPELKVRRIVSSTVMTAGFKDLKRSFHGLLGIVGVQSDERENSLLCVYPHKHSGSGTRSSPFEILFPDESR